MEIDLLGRFAVRRGGRSVESAEFGGRRVRQLVRMLAAERGRVVSRDVLIEALWGEQLPASPGTNLNVVVNRARRALGEPEVIQTAEGGYLLPRGTELVVDVERFEELVVLARAARSRGDQVTAAGTAQAALELWDEPFPEDAYTEWARPHRDRLERLHQDALEIGTEGLLATGNPREAVALAAQAVARQPLREAAYLLLVRAYAAEGDQAAAVATYLDLRRVLADELGIDPSPEATATYDQLLHGTMPASTVSTRPRSRSHLPPLVGRERELTELLALGPHQRIAVVSGRSGWGKSRLLDALCGQASRPVLLARALHPEREEPWSLARTLMQTPPASAVDPSPMLGPVTLAALADVLPDLEAKGPAVEPRSRRALVLQGLLRLVEATAPSLLVIDDLQWADPSTLELLALLAGRSSDVVMVCAYRPEEVAEDSPAARFLREVAETRPVQVPLGSLGTPALAELVTSPTMAVALTEHTDGTPFAVLQVLRSLESEGLLRRIADGGWDVVEEPSPDRIRELARAGQRDSVWRQFERLPRDARRLLAVLSLLARPAPVRLLSAVCGVSVDDAIGMLRDLARSHLVGHDAEGFRVDHDLVGETIRDRLDAVERAGLHHRIAGSLAGDDGPVEELARHLAGAGDAAAAAAAYAEVARSRMEHFADHEAGQLASEGLALDPPSRVRATLLEVRAETLARKGDIEAARDDLRAALATTTSGPARSRLRTRLAQLTFGAEDLLRASELADLALAEAGEDPGARARATYVRALVDFNLGRLAVAETRFDEALRLFTATGDAAGMADIVEARAMITFGRDINGGIDQFDRAAMLFADAGNLLRVVWPRSCRGYGLHFAGRPLEGLEETSAALELSRRLGYAEGEAMTLYHHAEVLVGCGRADEALLNAEAGLALGRRLGHRASMATTSLALGVAHAALDHPADAIAAFEESLRISGEHQNVLFRCWGQARLALVLIDQGRLDDAAAHVDEALAIGPDLAQYEARLAQCELAVRRGDDDTGALVDGALELAVAGGHAVTAARLERLRELIT